MSYDSDIKQQRKNIFYTRCHITNKVCYTIIDSESYANVALVHRVQIYHI
jgi:hypothetical protein